MKIFIKCGLQKNSNSWIAFTLLFFLSLIIYSSTFQSSWHFDDKPNIVNNYYLHLNNLHPNSLLQTLFTNPRNPWYIGEIGVHQQQGVKSETCNTAVGAASALMTRGDISCALIAGKTTYPVSPETPGVCCPPVFSHSRHIVMPRIEQTMQMNVPQTLHG